MTAAPNEPSAPRRRTRARGTATQPPDAFSVPRLATPVTATGRRRPPAATNRARRWIVLAIAPCAALLVFVAGAARSWTAAGAGTTRPPGPAAETPRIYQAELWYATTPATGVWAELKVVLDNPLPADASAPGQTQLLLPASFLEDFTIRSAEPKPVAPPRRRADGRAVLTFPRALAQSMNWYRIFLEVQRTRPRPIQVGVVLTGPAYVVETEVTRAQVFYADRKADPFLVVPERLVAWIPGQGHSAFPVLVAYATAIALLAVAGTAIAFWMVRQA